jgi:hypothetical protein
MIRHGKGPVFRSVGPTAQVAGVVFQGLGLVGAAQFIPKLQMPIAFGGAPRQPGTGPTASSGVPTAAGPPPTTAGAGGVGSSSSSSSSGGGGGMRAQCPMDFAPADIPVRQLSSLSICTGCCPTISPWHCAGCCPTTSYWHCAGCLRPV